MDEKLTVDFYFEKQEEDMISRSKDLELGIVDPDMKLGRRGPKSIKNAKKETRTQEEDTERESSAPGREPSLEAVAEKMGIPLERVWSMLKVGREPVSLQERIRGEGASEAAASRPKQDTEGIVYALTRFVLIMRFQPMLNFPSDVFCSHLPGRGHFTYKKIHATLHHSRLA